ncbi:MAG: TMEM143 family protein [Thermodesulfobacteriota bacterium]
MAEYSNRERYIPFRCRDVVRMLTDEGSLKTDEQKADFGKFCEIVASVYHFSFHKKLEALKDGYFLMSPDMRPHRPPTAEELRQANHEVLSTLEEVLNDANYVELRQEDLALAYGSSGYLRVKIRVDLDDFETVKFFQRGSRKEIVTHKTLWGLREHVQEEEIFERVVFIARFKPAAYFEAEHRRHLPFEPGSTIIKLFKDIPKRDMEMLFPNSRIGMTVRDKLYVLGPAILAGIPLLTTKLLTSLFVLFTLVGAYFGYKGTVQANEWEQAIALLSVGGAVGSFVVRQWLAYKNRKYQIQKELSDNLYFRNLVNNVGVFHSLVDAAEEEECKEVFLAYYFLQTSEKGLTAGRLDDTVEAWFETRHDCKLDFEIGDGLRKLLELGLIHTDDNKVLHVLPLKEALRRVDELWDGFFPFNDPGVHTEPCS